jgi:hypothetical protein
MPGPGMPTPVCLPGQGCGAINVNANPIPLQDMPGKNTLTHG